MVVSCGSPSFSLFLWVVSNWRVSDAYRLLKFVDFADGNFFLFNSVKVANYNSEVKSCLFLSISFVSSKFAGQDLSLNVLIRPRRQRHTAITCFKSGCSIVFGRQCAWHLVQSHLVGANAHAEARLAFLKFLLADVL